MGEGWDEGDTAHLTPLPQGKYGGRLSKAGSKRVSIPRPVANKVVLGATLLNGSLNPAFLGVPCESAGHPLLPVGRHLNYPKKRLATPRWSIHQMQLMGLFLQPPGQPV